MFSKKKAKKPSKIEETEELSFLEVYLAVKDLYTPYVGTDLALQPMIIVQEDIGEVGRTESIQQIPGASHVPQSFAKCVRVEVKFEEDRELHFLVVDVAASPGASASDPLCHQIGAGTTSLSALFTAPNQALKLPLFKDGQQTGTLYAQCRQPPMDSGVLRMKMQGEDLIKCDTFGKSDPFLTFFSQSPDGKEWQSVFKTSVMMNTLNPDFKEFAVPFTKLCCGDYSRPILIQCDDWNQSKKPDFIGSVITDVNSLMMAAVSETGMPLKNKTKVTGRLVISKCECSIEPSFLDFVQSGCDFNFFTGIDFTVSNGNPLVETSLHHKSALSGSNLAENVYATLTTVCGSVFEFHSAHKSFLSYGFGFANHPGQAANHCFPLITSSKTPMLNGTRGLLEAYELARTGQVIPYGRRILSQVINRTVDTIVQWRKSNPNRYAMLLMMVAGNVDPMDRVATVQALAMCSEVGVHVVFACLGDCDGSDYEKLGEEAHAQLKQLSDSGRDCICRNPSSVICIKDFSKVEDDTRSPSELIKRAIFSKFPGQCLQYMHARSIMPPSKGITPISSFTVEQLESLKSASAW
eukprot:TRINITY_DN3478_c0_g2_i1.p1 TRINITY_DN3478_c0_g2~~TRINITY_DN3478_c0_g2_i1.p1  ORF type:complete len:579 (-),score=153.45 TRINITY_DN3478_c0_g2_i1:241-1977(-)